MWMWSPCSVAPWALCVPHCTSSRVASDFWRGFLKIDDLFVITACPSRSKRESHTHTYIGETEYHFSLCLFALRCVCGTVMYIQLTQLCCHNWKCLFGTSFYRITAAIIFSETIRIGYVYNLAFWILANFVCVHCALRDSWILYIIGEFEIWR